MARQEGRRLDNSEEGASESQGKIGATKAKQRDEADTGANDGHERGKEWLLTANDMII